MAEYVKSIEATGVYGRFNFNQEFQPGVNVIYGKNGAGKTTFLHILSNVLNGDYKRFAYIKFDSIEAKFDDGTQINVRRYSKDEEAHIEVKINGDVLSDFPLSEVKHVTRRARYYATAGGQRRLFDDTKDEQSFEPILPADYFPAFRTMIEAWASVQDDSESVRRHELNEQGRRIRATRLARELFGNFVPQVTFPSPLEIEQRLTTEISYAVINVAQRDQELLSRAFLDIFTSLPDRTTRLNEPPELILDHINSLYESLEDSPIYARSVTSASDVYMKLRELFGSFRLHEGSNTAIRILDVYRNSLVERTRVLKESFAVINRYLDAVNEFFEGKKIEIVIQREPRVHSPLIGIKFDNDFSIGLRTLSSGERQIVTLIYAATHMNEQRVVLIDEPELSLHVDWQRLLLSKMSEQLQGRQIIACTHSPLVAADYEGRMKELRPINAQNSEEISSDEDGSDDCEDNE
jgi:ABC-type lipoprotein export system ATPase subunit